MENFNPKDYLKWLGKPSNIIKLTLSLLIGFSYAYFYPLANYDPSSTLDRYEVGIVDLDKTDLSNEFLNNLQQQKKFKRVDFENKEEMLNNLKKQNKLFLGIVINKNYEKVIKDLDKFEFNKSNIDLYENTKKAQMTSTINSNFKNKVEQVNALVVSENVGNNLENKFVKKVKSIHKVVDELKNLKDKMKAIDLTVEKDIDYYSTLSANLKTDVNNIKEILNNQFLKSTYDNLKGEAKDLSGRVKGLNKSTIINNISKGNFNNAYGAVNNIKDKATRQILLNDLNTISNVSQQLGSMTSNIDISKIDVDSLYKKLNNSKVNKIDLSKVNLNPQLANFVSDINNMNANLKKLLILVKQINSANIMKMKNQANNIDKKKLFSSVTNLDFDEISGIVQTLKDPRNVNETKEKINKAKEGISKIISGVELFEDKTNKVLKNYKLDELSSKIASLYTLLLNPSIYETTNIDKAQKEGIALIPFGLMLGMWILCLFTIEIIFPKEYGSVVNKYAFAFIYLLVFGFIHILTIHILGWEISNYFLYVLIIMFIGYCFFTIQRLFYELLGKVAPLLLTLFFIIQVTSSGATIPIELMNKFFQNITNYIPLKYGTNIIRELIVNPNYSIIRSNMFILFIFAIISHLLILIKKLLHKNKNEVNTQGEDVGKD